MLSFNNDPKLKELLLEEIIAHRKADLLYQGAYKKLVDGKEKFCAVGCAIHTLNIKLGKTYDEGDHQVYETELGIPRQLAYLEDRFFEKKEKEQAMVWPERFINAIPVGVDLSMVVPKFMWWLMGDIKQFIKNNQRVLDVITTVENLYRRKVQGEIIKDEEWFDARAAAYAVYAAYAAAAYAYAVYADAAYVDAVYAVVYAVDAAAAAYAAAAYADAAYAAKKMQIEKMADKLIEIIQETKS